MSQDKQFEGVLSTSTIDKGVDSGAGVGVSVAIAWAWNSWNPDMEMPPEVAAAIGAVIGPMVEDIRRLRRRLFDRWMGD